ncbi:MAG: LysM peptidoglycan-binding domain-containing protein [Bacteroidales bacterium]|nr:LysM peptidoglycan-binding domain-containing protein [Bacteroidales bacterium]MCF8327619.1 LysM peptidoglycan-binding domain-containing protein [Bacteroidales bacterium]
MILVPNPRLQLSGNSRLISSLLLLVLLIFTNGLSAQEEKPVKRSGVIEEIDGREYYIHEIKQGHTVYSIAKAYNVSPEEIYKHNPEAKKVIKPSQMLKIPAWLVDEAEEKKEATNDQSSRYRYTPQENETESAKTKIIEHEVEKKETLYSLARKYNTTVARIKELNPNMVDILEVGQKIKVPANESVAGKTNESDSLIYYTVDKGETLYRIAAKHNISVDTIIRLNPEVAEGLKAGSVIKLPKPYKTETAESKPAVAKQDTSDKYLKHKVAKGETLYNLSMQYSIAIDELKKHNPQLKEGLKAGQVLRIPVESRKEDEQFVFLKEKEFLDSLAFVKQKDTMLVDCDSVSIKQSYKIALFVPLYLNQMRSIDASDYDKPGWPEQNVKPFAYIQFYEGFKLALDSLEKQGLKADVYVHDTKADTSVVKELVNDPEFKSYDLIFGPLQDDALEIVTNEAKTYSINVISPVSYAMNVVKGNDHLIKLFPPVNYQINRIMNFVAEEHAKDNIVYVHGASDRQMQLKVKLQSILNKKLGVKDSVLPYKMVNYNTQGFSKIKEVLDESKPNFIFCTHKGEIRINKMISRLNGLREDYEIIIFGSNAWENYNSIESEYLNNLNYTSFTEYLIDYDDIRVKTFVNRFTRKYKTWPNKMAFKGFDAGYYFLNALYNYGVNFQYCMENMNKFTMHNDFHFKQWENNAWQNSEINIYQYRDFKRVLLNRNIKTPLKDNGLQDLIRE